MRQIKTFFGKRIHIEKDMNKWLRRYSDKVIVDIQIRPQFGWVFFWFVGAGSHDKHIGYITYKLR